MDSAIEILGALEARAQRAIVQELRLIANEVRTLHPSLTPEDRAYADALLWKLDRLEAEQCATGIAGCDASVRLAPYMATSVDAEFSDAEA